VEGDVPAVPVREPECLADGNGDEPPEQRWSPVGLMAQELDPGLLARVLDQVGRESYASPDDAL